MGVFVDDLEAHLARAQDNGAILVHGITSYGFTSDVALDIEGRSWRFQRGPASPAAVELNIEAAVGRDIARDLPRAGGSLGRWCWPRYAAT